MHVPLFTLVALLAVQSGFDGLWWRDDDASDDAEARIEASVAGYIKKRTRGRGTVEDADPRFVKRLNSVIDAFVQHADEIHVERTQRELVVDDGGDDLRIYYLDGGKHERQMADGTRLETVATALGARIEIAMKTNDGSKVFETYELDSSGDSFVLTVRLEDKDLIEPLVIRNVYTRAE